MNRLALSPEVAPLFRGSRILVPLTAVAAAVAGLLVLALLRASGDDPLSLHAGTAVVEDGPPPGEAGNARSGAPGGPGRPAPGPDAVPGEPSLPPADGIDTGATPGPVLRGRVVDPAGEGITTAVVRVLEGFPSTGNRSWSAMLAAALPEQERARADTGPDGRFAFEAEALAPGTYNLQASADGHGAAQVHAVVVPSGGRSAELEIVLGPGQELAGRILRDPGRVPVKGALVSALWEDPRGPWQAAFHHVDRFQTRSDAEGAFRFDALPAGRSWKLVASKEGLSSAVSRVEALPTEEEIVLVLEAGCALTGRVLDDLSGRPVAGCDVVTRQRSRRDEILQRTVTDAEGAFRVLDLAPGPCTVVLRAAGYSILSDGFEDPEGEREFRLRRGIRVRGRVLDARTREPIAGAWVYPVTRYDGWFGREGIVKALTAADGSFDLAGAPVERHHRWDGGRRGPAQPQDRVQLAAYKARWVQESSAPVELQGGLEQVEGVEILLAPAPVASGHVLDENHRPLAGALVRTLKPSNTILPGGIPTGDDLWESVSDAEGAFRITLPQGPRKYLFAYHSNAAFTFEDIGPLPGDQEVRDVEIVLRPGGSLEGSVTDERGDPVPNAPLDLSFRGPAGARSSLASYAWAMNPDKPLVTTDTAGTFRVAHLAPGTWTVAYRPPDGRPLLTENAEVPEGAAATVRIRLEPAVMLEGTVVDADGTPVSGVYVHATIPTIPRAARGARSEPDGRFRIAGLTPGTYKITLTHRTYETTSVDGIQAGSSGLRLVLKGRRTR